MVVGVLLGAGCFAQGKVVLKAGTLILAQLETIIDVASSNAGDDFSLTTAEEINAEGAKIEKGTVLTGRILTIKKSATATDNSEVRLLFDFMKKGESFMTLNALIIAVKRNDKPLEMKFASAPNFSGASVITQKGKNISLEKGDIFQIKIQEDLKTDN